MNIPMSSIEAWEFLASNIQDPKQLKALQIIKKHEDELFNKYVKSSERANHFQEVLTKNHIPIYEKKIQELKELIKYWEISWSNEAKQKDRLLTKIEHGPELLEEISEGLEELPLIDWENLEHA